MPRALLIIGHGSRSSDAATVFQRIVDSVREKSDFDAVFGCHLELSPPGAEETLEEALSRGINEITVVPYFLYEGYHSKNDIAGVISRFKAKHPGTVLRLGRPIGFDPAMAGIIINRAKNAALI